MTKPQTVASAGTKTVTVIGAANALGNHIPPFYIFTGKRWCDELLEGVAPGSHGGRLKVGL
ncbi:hypothetical protein DPMN_039902 [Dreissena polymorpha]|uniref:Uncharacterized protein n=1 Tax=Dreissena polymorpha TaxID=45954 RepID=A0A9D4CWQ9_DREPO|nr:hypothetical protein DPMN_039902 [Dreissena polymorpha]